MSRSLAILIGLGPFIGWGLFPTAASKFGGKPTNQILGATFGTLIFGILWWLIVSPPVIDAKQFLFAMASGFGWAFAQILLFHSFIHIGSSVTQPITTAYQLIVISLWGVFVFGNWATGTDKLIGFVCLAGIIFGAYLTSWKQKKNPVSSRNLKIAIVLITVAVVGQWLYSVMTQFGHVNGSSAFFPQACGMVLTAVGYAGFMMLKRHHNYFADAVSYKQILVGFLFGFGSLTYLISIQPNVNGLATGLVMSQANVILATLTGIYVLHQYKTHREMTATVWGLLLIFAGSAVTALI